jgi:hypothetical protein
MDDSAELAKLLLAYQTKTREILKLRQHIASNLDKIYSQIICRIFPAQNGRAKLFFGNL